MIRVLPLSREWRTYVVFRGTKHLGLIKKMRSWQWLTPNLQDCRFRFKNLIDAARACLRENP